MALRDLLSVAAVSDDHYVSRPEGEGFQFGGLTLGVALCAAEATVSPGMVPRYCQANFHRAGVWGAPTDLTVQRLTDGRSFATRAVQAQQDGRTIATMTASFHTPGEGISWQARGLQGAKAAEELLPAVSTLPLTKLIDLRPLIAPAVDPLSAELHPYWGRSTESLGAEAITHYAALAFISDYLVVQFVHAADLNIRDYTVRTLDHSVWFHRPVDLTDWHLFSTDAMSIAHGRGFAHGTVHNADGLLVASFAQAVVVI